MSFEIEYFHGRVLAEIESWPVDVVADYARLAELLSEYGPSLRLPHSRAFGDGLFELRACEFFELAAFSPSPLWGEGWGEGLRPGHRCCPQALTPTLSQREREQE